MTHEQLCERARRWLSGTRRCDPVFSGIASCDEIPDAIGWSSRYGWYGSTVVECAFIRKEAKKYGTQRVVEGVDIKGKNVLVLENIATSGGEVMTTTRKLRALGAVVTHALVVVDQEEGGLELTGIGGVSLLSLLKKSDFDGLSPEK